MRNGHKLSLFLYFAASVFVLGSGRYQISLRHADLVSPVADEHLAYDWQALDQRINSLAAQEGSRPVTAALHTVRGMVGPNPTKTPVKTAYNTPGTVSLVLSDRTGGASLPILAQKIKDYFPEDPITAYAIFSAESSLNPKAQGWNCHYYTRTGKRYSAACRVEHRSQAWSVDCGLAQINVLGTDCPKNAFDIDWSLSEARKKYEARKWKPWVAYTAKRHVKHLAAAREVYE